MPSQQSAKTAYQNPIIPGFAPDPSVVVVNETYFLVTSSFHIFPGLPIYASKDLQTWVHIGNAINRSNQVDLTKTFTKVVPLHTGGTMIGAGGLFAPTIRHYNDTFYIVCTNVAAEGENFEAENFMISTTDIWSDNWSDPVPLELYGIDPSLFLDDDGRVYLQGSFRLDRTEQPTSTISQYEIDLSTGKRLSDIREIWSGAAKVYTEGPHIYKKDGLYYLLVAEGGTFEHHMLSIARAVNIWGPYEPFEGNPILTSYGKNEFVQDAGHGELFQDHRGHWWAAVLGVRKVEGRYPMGRESFLCPVRWSRGEWPSIEHPQTTFSRVAVAQKTAEWSSLLSRELCVDDCYIRNPVKDDYQFLDGKIWMLAGPHPLSSATGTATFLGKRQRSFCACATATLVCANLYEGAPKAGLAVYKDDLRYAMVLYRADSLEIELVLRNNSPDDRIVAAAQLEFHPRWLQLEIVSSKLCYEFWWKASGGADHVLLGVIDAAELTCRDFTGTIFGVHAQISENADRSWVEFNNVFIRASS